MESNSQSLQRILRLKDVSHCVGLSRSSIYLKISQGEFPKPIKIGKRGTGWLENEIQEWISARVLQTRSVSA